MITKIAAAVIILILMASVATFVALGILLMAIGAWSEFGFYAGLCVVIAMCFIMALLVASWR